MPPYGLPRFPIMTRLLVLTELFLPTKGGTAVWAAEVYRRLGGKEIHIVTADVAGAAAVDATHPNTIHRLSLRRVAWLRPESLAMYARFFLRSLRLALRLADRFIANSDHTLDTLRGMGVDPARITLIYPGVYVSVFRPGLDTTGLRESLGIGTDEKLLFSVGRLSRRKGFDQMIRAVGRLHAEGMPLRYVIGGIGEDADYLDVLIHDLGLTGVVHRIGPVREADLPRWQNACDIFAMPNREINGDNDGFGMVFIEAAACGKPSLAGLAGGTGSAVLFGVSGLRVDGTSVDAVADGLRSLLAQPDLTRAWGQRALQRVEREFSWERVAEKTRQLNMTTTRS